VSDASLDQRRKDGERDQGQQQRSDREIGRVEDRDDGDGDEVVHDGQSEQEAAQ
jgi:hypothetical protein